MSQVFFCSDTHYSHKNICLGTSEWGAPEKCRPFSTLEAMNDALVETINARVGANDTLYHLGDWSFGGKDQIRKFRERLNCNDIYLVLGNHDHHQERDPDQWADCFTRIYPSYAQVVVHKQEIVLCHYALRVWNNQHKGAWHLYGHSHGKLRRIANKSIDVGVDAYRAGTLLTAPWSMDALINAFATDNVAPEDHHDEQTVSPPFRQKE